MSAWGNTNNIANTPLFVGDLAATHGYTANIAQDFGNTVFGVTATEADLKRIAPGWVHVNRKYGPIVNVAIVSGGNAYTNTSTVTINGNGGNGAIAITTNANGAIVTATVTNPGSYYSVSNVAIANGTGAVLTVTLGGQSGRHTYETLVVMSSMSTANAASDYVNLP